ncbi:hypothetical protein [Mesorhizobium sp.]|uniref:hypothetical protein n=1 Tax=Mesorhizobium sp. TaxID=1871066 RepID=UPI000FE7DEC2|nr:hypothetical protein [Mesorhizobium sp.]RWI28746.1 MAG: hypothetical protein EOQ92_05775 [Mesorhizobium sp.]RWK45492.1 MAG: hypothetical protein EOR47_30735 [Mesorhizobium sp.]RWK91708.1 MAG: hypothetical protein EOR53_28345 [Mesorhizobium sp.]TIP57996.1 MAG: hypothetical protein E5X56_17335 [Mesorhizobium sp.]TIQ25260.1 MAG: hypothetical protein E5X54_30950 [Mesorhizobium sp.]
MPSTLETHIENLSTALSELKATGDDGFEGLIAVTLNAITGIPFRLANSGYQRGVDGKSAFEGAVAFEGKLYTNDLPRKDVLSKIPDLVRHNDHADLVWVLGATCTVPSQLADDLRADGAKEGIGVLILDWVPSDFPRLAVALAMGGGKVEDFLKANLKSDDARKKASAALPAIRADGQYPHHEKAIRRNLDAPGMATAMAKKANAGWFEETLSNKDVARSELGQPLAPNDTAVTVLGRDDLVNILSPYFSAAPNDGVVCVHGEEGCGKSWIVIQSWLAQSDKPLLVFATPDDFSDAATQDDIEARLTAKLVAQTGEVKSEESAIRWRRRLKAWKSDDKPSRPRLILVIDGINQRPGRAWGRIISNVATYMNPRGGLVIFTARTHYFGTRVKKALTFPVKEVTVSKWSTAERDQILKRRNVPLNKLNPSVAEFLRNPRLLSIALEVFGDDIAAFEELNVDRLLFEHIMAGVKEDFGEHSVDFIAHLRGQAKALSERATAQVRDDLGIFDSDVPAVGEGRFYRAVPGEPKKYELRDEGLALALGLSILENLRKAERNDRSLDDTLKEVLEPIEALDKTASAVIAAITVCAADDDEYSPEIARALIKGFSELQNPPSDALSALVSFARARPLALAETARDLSLQGGHQPNFDWIQAALVEAAKSSAVWAKVEEEVRRWLRVYSLSPERRMYSNARHDPQDKVAQERAKRQGEIDDNLSALSPAEKSRRDRLIETDGELDALSRLAFVLLAGKELEPFANALTDWSFANALNGSYRVPTKDFLALIGLNRRDWSQARSALLRACGDLSADTVSKTGKWARLRVLRATGDPEDDRTAGTLYEELTKDRQSPLGIRSAGEIIEPCDPLATVPADLEEAIQRYQSLEAGALRQSMGQTAQDHAFVDDRPLVARFALDTATEKHREFAEDVAKRTGMPLRQGLLELREHGALITEELARALIEKWKIAHAAADAQGLPKDEGIMLQYQLLIAFPFLDVVEQIAILLATTKDEPLLLELINETKTPDAQTLDRYIEDVLSSGAEYEQHLLLEIAAATGAELSDKACAFACGLISSKAEQLRSSALGLAARSGHPDLLKAVVESDWESSRVEGKDSFESWYGSFALLETAEVGLADGDAVLDRISPRLYGRAASMLKGPALQEIARRIDASIRFASGLPDELIAPEIEVEAEDATSDEPVRFSVSERESAPASPNDFFRRLSESNDEFRERQNRNHNAFIVFREELTAAKAHIILDNLTQEEFAAIAAANPAVAARWYNLFMELNDGKLPAVHNLILLLASAIADTDPGKSAALFERTAHSRPLVRFTFGKSGVDLGSMSAWTGGSSPALDAVRMKRLDGAATDQAIAVEVFSALQCGQTSFLESYVDEQLTRPQPAEIARGIMVAGFCNQSPRNDRILENYKNTTGLPGKAYAAAIAAYRSDSWARHWFKVICDTNDPVTFWQAGVLFAQCVDGRFSAWKDDFAQTGAPIAAFGTSLNNSLKRRHEKLGKERAKNLFGQDAPSGIFVHSTD